MKKQYVYKIKHKFKKNKQLLAPYGFIPYEEEGGEDKLMAMNIVIDENNSIFQYLKKAMEKIYSKANEQERAEDFKDYQFVDGNLVITDSIRNEFSHCQLCMYETGLGAWCLFINAPDRVQHYNTEIVNECAKEIVDKLLEDKVIYKALIK